MIRIIVGYTLVASFCFLGLLNLYRANLKRTDMTIINGKVVGKHFSFIYSKGRMYYLGFDIEGEHEMIAINLGGTKSDADKDSPTNLIDTGKTYKFYIDPTVPMSNNMNLGIRRIDFNDKEIFTASNSLNRNGGAFLCIVGLLGFYVVYNRKKWQKS
jgi:hypothetical protein